VTLDDTLSVPSRVTGAMGAVETQLWLALLRPLSGIPPAGCYSTPGSPTRLSGGGSKKQWQMRNSERLSKEILSLQTCRVESPRHNSLEGLKSS
jgi:hypothetical protein